MFKNMDGITILAAIFAVALMGIIAAAYFMQSPDTDGPIMTQFIATFTGLITFIIGKEGFNKSGGAK